MPKLFCEMNQSVGCVALSPLRSFLCTRLFVGLVICTRRPCRLDSLAVAFVAFCHATGAVLASPRHPPSRCSLPPCRLRVQHRRLGTTVVVAGYSSGGVRFFHAGNGTELGSADTGSNAVLAVKRGGQVKTKRRAGLVVLPYFSGG